MAEDIANGSLLENMSGQFEEEDVSASNTSEVTHAQEGGDTLQDGAGIPTPNPPQSAVTAALSDDGCSPDNEGSISPSEAAIDRPNLLRSPSVLSDGTSNSVKPDPPSIIQHQTVVDYDWVQEFLPRGCDVAQSLPVPSDADKAISHDSVIFRDEAPLDGGTSDSHLLVEDHEQQPPEEIDLPPMEEEQEFVNANAHHITRVESLLREDHGPSGSPLAAVLENEVLVPTPMVDTLESSHDHASFEGATSGSHFTPISHAAEFPVAQTFPGDSSPVRSTSDPRVYDAPAADARRVPLKSRSEDEEDDGRFERRNQSRPNAFQPTANLPSFTYGYTNQHNILTTPIVVRGSGRRRIRLRLQEEVRPTKTKSRRSLLGHLRSRSSQIMWGSRDFKDMDAATDGSGSGGPGSAASKASQTALDRGMITVSWFEGTSAIELQEHVRTSVLRKLGLEKGVDLADMRILDESSDPPEEIVLSPHIPDGSRFLLRYTTKTMTNDGATTPLSIYSGRAPDSPTPTPPANRLIGDLNASQLALLRKQLNALKLPQGNDVSVDERELTKSFRKRTEEEKKEESGLLRPAGLPSTRENLDTPPKSELDETKEATIDEEDDEDEQRSTGSRMLSDLDDDYDEMMLHSEDPIEARLRQITELLIVDRQKRRSKYSSPRREKRQVIFVLANYFVLFLSLIAISAEIQARAPGWLSSLENQLKNVQNCAENKDALFECVSNGDFAGLVASVLLYLSRSVATRRFFLFGFETPKKLWTVVYESLVTSVCWGFSYLFIRRGLNPDTRPQFVQKYWKDAVYGSLAGFNAAFTKHVLKNLIPQEAVEDVLRERQLKFLSWLPSFHG